MLYLSRYHQSSVHPHRSEHLLPGLAQVQRREPVWLLAHQRDTGPRELKESRAIAFKDWIYIQSFHLLVYMISEVKKISPSSQLHDRVVRVFVTGTFSFIQLLLIPDSLHILKAYWCRTLKTFTSNLWCHLNVKFDHFPLPHGCRVENTAFSR